MTPEDNPYYSIIGMMQKQGKAFNVSPFLIGKVMKTEPLTVQVGDIPVTRKNMKINSLLLGGYAREISIGETGATGTTGSTGGGGNDYDAFSSHSHSIQRVGIPSGQMTMIDGLRAGDEVLLLASADGQQYVLICKVV